MQNASPASRRRAGRWPLRGPDARRRRADCLRIPSQGDQNCGRQAKLGLEPLSKGTNMMKRWQAQCTRAPVGVIGIFLTTLMAGTLLIPNVLNEKKGGAAKASEADRPT